MHHADGDGANVLCHLSTMLQVKILTQHPMAFLDSNAMCGHRIFDNIRKQQTVDVLSLVRSACLSEDAISESRIDLFQRHLLHARINGNGAATSRIDVDGMAFIPIQTTLAEMDVARQQKAEGRSVV